MSEIAKQIAKDHEDIVAEIDKWYHDSNASGEEAFGEIEKRLKDSGLEVPEEIKTEFEAAKNTATDEIESARVDVLSELEDEARQSWTDDYMSNYTGDEERTSWLEDYWRDNLEGQFQSEATNEDIPRDTWYDGEYGKTLLFDTDAGWYEINVRQGRNTTLGDIHDVTFNDQGGSFDRTEKAGVATALRVMDRVSASMLAYMNNLEEPAAFTFSAKTEERQNVYERMVKTVAKIKGDYVAFKINTPDSDKYNTAYFAIVPKAKAKEAPQVLMSQYGGKEAKAELTQIVKGFGIQRKYPVRVTRLRHATSNDIYKWLTDPSAW